MKSSLNTDDFLVDLSVMLTLAGIILGAVFPNPRFIGYTALVVITLLISPCTFSNFCLNFGGIGAVYLALNQPVPFKNS